MPSLTYELMVEAMIAQRPVICIYHSSRRRVCPIMLGHDSRDLEKVLVSQIDPEDPVPWRCLTVSKIEKPELGDGVCDASLTRKGTKSVKEQSCMSDVDLDINPISPYNPKRSILELRQQFRSGKGKGKS